jgi:hypothetical protein
VINAAFHGPVCRSFADPESLIDQCFQVLVSSVSSPRLTRNIVPTRYQNRHSHLSVHEAPQRPYIAIEARRRAVADWCPLRSCT